MAWRCFMAMESEFVQISLRRYGAGGHENCPTTFQGKMSYHNAEAVIDPQAPGNAHELRGDIPDAELKKDPRWPKMCACGYAFHPEDHWQYNVDQLYRGALDGKLYRLRELPPGAIWRATWMEDIKESRYCNDAGEVWSMKLPGGDDWLIYSRVGPEMKRWDISGELPEITVSPSILIQGMGRYHGYVKSGVVTDDVDGNTFPQHPATA